MVGLILTPLFFVFRMMGRWCEGVLFKIKLENEIFPQTISEILCLLYPLLRACSCSDYTLMYAHIGRLAILHISNITFVHEREEGMLLFPESGPKKDFRVNGFTRTVTPHLRSIVPNVQRTWPTSLLSIPLHPSLSFSFAFSLSLSLSLSLSECGQILQLNTSRAIVYVWCSLCERDLLECQTSPFRVSKETY